MTKLTTAQIIKLLEYIESSNFNLLVALLKLNSKGQIEKFLKMIDRIDILDKIRNEESKAKIR